MISGVIDSSVNDDGLMILPGVSEVRRGALRSAQPTVNCACSAVAASQAVDDRRLTVAQLLTHHAAYPPLVTRSWTS